MKILLLFIAFIGILCHEVFTRNLTDEEKDKCRTFINEMEKYYTEAEYSEDQLKADFEGLSEEANNIKPFDKSNQTFLNTMKNAKKFFENIGQCADKSHIQKWVQQIRTNFNTLTIESDLLGIMEKMEHTYSFELEELEKNCAKLAKIQTDLRNDEALTINAVLKCINNAEEKCKNLAAKDYEEKERHFHFIPLLRDTLLTVKKTFYDEELNAKIEFINGMGLNVQETIGIARIFPENYVSFKNLLNFFVFKEDEQSKEHILQFLAHKTLEKGKELEIVKKLTEKIQTVKSIIDIEKMEKKNSSEIIKFRRDTRKELNSIIGLQTPEYSSEFLKTFYKTELENLLPVVDKTKFFNYFFLIDEMEQHLSEIQKLFKVDEQKETDNDENNDQDLLAGW